MIGLRLKMWSAVFRFGHEKKGVVAVEFAFVAPVMLAIFFGGYTVSQAVAVGRKITITTRALADLTTQYSTMAATDIATVFNAATEIVAPFDATPLQMRITEITTNSTGTTATVTWSVGRNLTAYTTGQTMTVPASMLVPNTSYIFSETSYLYTPISAISQAAMTMNDHIYMLPRISTAVAYTG